MYYDSVIIRKNRIFPYFQNNVKKLNNIITITITIIIIVIIIRKYIYCSGVDAGGCHCCQCSTPKWLTVISRVEFLFLKIL